MLYAQMNNYRAKDVDWPLEWEKSRDMFKYLNSMAWNHQLNIAKKMFATQYGPEYRCTLVKWVIGDGVKTREVLLETSDPKQMEAALFMLINEIEPEYKAQKQKMSWVP